MRFLVVKVLVFILIGFLGESFGQISVASFTKDNELTSNEITTTFIDSKGIVWVGTSKGLNAFTGSQWYPISHIETKSGKTKAIGKIIEIYEDRNGFLWTSTNKGLFMYNYSYWVDYINDESDEYLVKEFYEDSQNRLWTALEYTQDLKKDMGVVMINGTIHMFDAASWYEYDVDVAGTARLPTAGEINRYFTGFAEDNKGDIWLSSLEGLYSYNGEEWTEHEKEEIEAKIIFSLLRDKHDDIWIASENGVSKYSSGKWTNYKLGIVHVLKMDPVGRLWAYTHSDYSFSGLNMFDGSNWNLYSANDIDLKASVDQLIFSDSLVLAYSNKGVSAFTAGSWSAYSVKSGLKDSKYFKIIKDRFGKVWLAGEKTIYQLREDHWDVIFKPKNSWEVEVLFVDSKGRCWVGTKKNGVFVQPKKGDWIQYSEKNKLADNHIENIFEDKRGNIWVVTDNGLSVFSDK